MAFLNVRGHQKITEVIKNDIGEAVRLLTKQLRQIAIHKCQFESLSSSSLNSSALVKEAKSPGFNPLLGQLYFKLKT